MKPVAVSSWESLCNCTWNKAQLYSYPRISYMLTAKLLLPWKRRLKKPLKNKKKKKEKEREKKEKGKGKETSLCRELCLAVRHQMNQSEHRQAEYPNKYLPMSQGLYELNCSREHTLVADSMSHPSNVNLNLALDWNLRNLCRHFTKMQLCWRGYMCMEEM